jgi:DNA-binding MarR family transcriptional regulator
LNGNDSSVGRWISILYRYRLNYLGKRLEPYNIGSGQHLFLMVLSKNDGINQEELSSYLKIDKATTAKAIKKLEEEGYVIRRIDDIDKRAYRVFLTDKGRDVIPIIDEAVKDWEEFVTGGFSKKERILVEALLGKMAQNACRIKK